MLAPADCVLRNFPTVTREAPLHTSLWPLRSYANSSRRKTPAENNTARAHNVATLRLQRQRHGWQKPNRCSLERLPHGLRLSRSLSAPATCTKASRGRRIAVCGRSVGSDFRFVLAPATSGDAADACSLPDFLALHNSRCVRFIQLFVRGGQSRIARTFRATGPHYPHCSRSSCDDLTKPACSADNFPAPPSPCTDASHQPAPRPWSRHHDGPTHRPRMCKSSSCDHLAAFRCASD